MIKVKKNNFFKYLYRISLINYFRLKKYLNKNYSKDNKIKILEKLLILIVCIKIYMV